MQGRGSPSRMNPIGAGGTQPATGRKRPLLEKERLLTDRAAYISYLEVQLERVSAACMTAQGFSDRIEQQQAQLTTAEEKIVNSTRLVKLAMSYIEQQGADFDRAVQ